MICKFSGLTRYPQHDWFSNSGDLSVAVCNFLRTQDCFRDRLSRPQLNIDFCSFKETDIGGLSIVGNVIWDPFNIHIPNLAKSLSRGAEYRIIPTLREKVLDRNYRSYPLEVLYRVFSNHLPLAWDQNVIGFRAIVPDGRSYQDIPHEKDGLLATMIKGAHRQKTMFETELTITTTRSFLGTGSNIRFEQTARYNILLEVTPRLTRQNFNPYISHYATLPRRSIQITPKPIESDSAVQRAKQIDALSLSPACNDKLSGANEDQGMASPTTYTRIYRRPRKPFLATAWIPSYPNTLARVEQRDAPRSKEPERNHDNECFSRNKTQSKSLNPFAFRESAFSDSTSTDDEAEYRWGPNHQSPSAKGNEEPLEETKEIPTRDDRIFSKKANFECQQPTFSVSKRTSSYELHGESSELAPSKQTRFQDWTLSDRAIKKDGRDWNKAFDKLLERYVDFGNEQHGSIPFTEESGRATSPTKHISEDSGGSHESQGSVLNHAKTSKFSPESSGSCLRHDSMVDFTAPYLTEDEITAEDAAFWEELKASQMRDTRWISLSSLGSSHKRDRDSSSNPDGSPSRGVDWDTEPRAVPAYPESPYLPCAEPTPSENDQQPLPKRQKQNDEEQSPDLLFSGSVLGVLGDIFSPSSRSTVKPNGKEGNSNNPCLGSPDDAENDPYSSGSLENITQNDKESHPENLFFGPLDGAYDELDTSSSSSLPTICITPPDSKTQSLDEFLNLPPQNWEIPKAAMFDQLEKDGEAVTEQFHNRTSPTLNHSKESKEVLKIVGPNHHEQGPTSPVMPLLSQDQIRENYKSFVKQKEQTAMKRTVSTDSTQREFEKAFLEESDRTTDESEDNGDSGGEDSDTTIQLASECY